MTSEDVYLLSLQPTWMPLAHEDDEALCASYVSAANFVFKLAFGYAICKEYFTYGSHDVIIIDIDACYYIYLWIANHTRSSE